MPITTQRISASQAMGTMRRDIEKGNWVNALQYYLEKNGYAKPAYIVKQTGTPQKPQFVATVTANDSPFRRSEKMGTGETVREAKAHAARILMESFCKLGKSNS